MLGQLVEQAQAEGAGDGDVLVTATQADIAQLAGSSRESASRFLAVLERAGSSRRAAGSSPSMTPRRSSGTSTEARSAAEREFSAGGVVVARRNEVV